jgi:acetyl/propionyl-CoA carboxylase alpha subunit
MGAAAVAIAREIGYVGAGTVEFLVDARGAFYFLEMNTRLQVEHPVTESTTGIDLVRAQLRVAGGERLPWTQEEIRWTGHAIECRINAEDPERGFLPSAGWIRSVRLPQGPGVRNDIGFHTGTEVTSHYDPMIGKLIVWGATREEAVERAARAIAEYRIVGVRTNLPFHRWLLAHPRFRAGGTDTGFLEEEFRSDVLRDEDADLAAILAAAVAELRGSRFRQVPTHGTGRPAHDTTWKRLGRPGGGLR